MPLHNNPAELAPRNMVQGRNISYATQTLKGTQPWDTFMCLVATTRKLGISCYEKSALNPFGYSWIPE
ncbi:hypothetical protein [Trichormus azollae]|uniref:hypothetical protein n=1 Tax=Trichormus azollae TaxID=1164 RepID=UPI00325F164A